MPNIEIYPGDELRSSFLAVLSDGQMMQRLESAWFLLPCDENLTFTYNNDTFCLPAPVSHRIKAFFVGSQEGAGGDIPFGDMRCEEFAKYVCIGQTEGEGDIASFIYDGGDVRLDSLYVGDVMGLQSADLLPLADTLHPGDMLGISFFNYHPNAAYATRKEYELARIEYMREQIAVLTRGYEHLENERALIYSGYIDSLLSGDVPGEDDIVPYYQRLRRLRDERSGDYCEVWLREAIVDAEMLVPYALGPYKEPYRDPAHVVIYIGTTSDGIPLVLSKLGAGHVVISPLPGIIRYYFGVLQEPAEPVFDAEEMSYFSTRYIPGRVLLSPLK